MSTAAADGVVGIAPPGVGSAAPGVVGAVTPGAAPAPGVTETAAWPSNNSTILCKSEIVGFARTVHRY